MAEQEQARGSRSVPALPPGPSSQGIQALVDQVGRNECSLADLNKSLLNVFRQFWSKRIKGNPELVDELSNITVGESIQALVAGRYDPTRAKFLTYAYSVSMNIARRQTALKTRRRELELSSLPTLDDNVAAANLGDLELSEKIEAMRDCLEAHHPQGITADESYVIVGLTNGKTISQLGKELSLSLDSIHRRKMRACEKLRKCMALKGWPNNG